MSKKLIICMIVWLTQMAVPAIAENIQVTPYAGFDIQWRQMGFKAGYGDNQVKRHYPQANFYVGSTFNEYIGFELGYEKSVKKSRTVLITRGDKDFGHLFSDPAFTYTTKVDTTIQGFHANAVGSYPLSKEYRLHCIASVGLAQLKLKVMRNVPTSAGGPNPDAASVRREFVKTKYVPRLSAGLQYVINEHFGIRAMLTWEKTSKFKNLKPVNNGTSPLRASVKDSTNLGLGIFYQF